MAAAKIGLNPDTPSVAATSKNKFEHAVTDELSRRTDGVDYMIREESGGRVSTLQTHGTNFMTEKASNQSKKIVQSKENIILSDTSSLLAKSPGASRSGTPAAQTTDK